MLNDRPWCWRYQNQNSWSLLAVQNCPADKDPGRPGAIATNGPGTALQRYTGQGSALPPQDAGVTNKHTTGVNKKRRDTGISRRSRDNSLFPCIVGKGRPTIPLEIGPHRRNPRPSHPLVLCGILVPWIREKGSSTLRKTRYHSHWTEKGVLFPRTCRITGAPH